MKGQGRRAWYDMTGEVDFDSNLAELVREPGQ